MLQTLLPLFSVISPGENFMDKKELIINIKKVIM